MPDLCEHELGYGWRCQRPAGHDGEHMTEGEVPPLVAQILGDLMERAEVAERKANRARRWYNIGLCVWLAAVVANVIATSAGGDASPWDGFWLGTLVGAFVMGVAIIFGGAIRRFINARKARA
jgi:hypothetical protein